MGDLNPVQVPIEDCHHNHHIKTSTENEKNEEAFFPQQSRWSNLLSFSKPSKTLENPSPSNAKIDTPSQSCPGSISGKMLLPPRSTTTKFKTTMRYLLPQKNCKEKHFSHDGDKTVLISDVPSSCGPLDKPSTLKSFSVNKAFFLPSPKVAHSLPVTPAFHQQICLDSHFNSPHMTRSLSVPVNYKTRRLREPDFGGGVIHVVSTSRHLASDGASPTNDSVIEIANETSEDIPEEDAVCRICLVELGEGGDILKMECHCKGELALAHQDCAVKWFSIKGNKTCELCNQDVKNLSVTLLKIQNPQTAVRRQPAALQQMEVAHYRFWQDVTVLVVVCILGYFCFLEQFLVSDLGPGALSISLPFSCILGLLSSMIASTMVNNNYIWAYASFQFGIVIVFSYIFNSAVNVKPILSVVLASFIGFGIAIITISLLIEYHKWRHSRNFLNDDVNRAMHHQLQQREQQLPPRQQIEDSGNIVSHQNRR